MFHFLSINYPFLSRETVCPSEKTGYQGAQNSGNLNEKQKAEGEKNNITT